MGGTEILKDSELPEAVSGPLFKYPESKKLCSQAYPVSGLGWACQ